ncbi:ATP-binding protein [Streptomyces sp. Ncost-T6T-1]|uniref:ATP-binding protein n=1 Tax=Streptomyces sp. Ncost-T6T-1 TaxID=1100828 RepID=UPI00159EE882|nr:ATP-binding protein [Streptomyces sp. Ncost-T6T-1]
MPSSTQAYGTLPPLLEQVAVLLESSREWAPSEQALASAEQLLSRGPGPGAQAAPLHELGVAPDRFSWLCLREAATDQEPRLAAARATAAWSSLAALRRPAALVIGADRTGRAGVAIGLDTGANGIRQWLSDQAPDMIWEPGAPPGWSVVADPAHTEEALVCRSRSADLPAGGGLAEDQRLPHLSGLLGLPLAGWCVVLTLLPLNTGELTTAGGRLAHLRAQAARRVTASEGITEHRQNSVVDPRGEAVTAALGAWQALVDDCLRTGGWSIGVHLCARTPETAAVVRSAFCRALRSESAAAPEGRAQDWDTARCLAGAAPAVGWLSSRDLGSLLVPPTDALGDLQVRSALPAGRRSSRPRRTLSLGNWLGTDLPAQIDVDDLAGHAFVAGITGSGKSTTTSSLLLQLWNDHRVPFLVIDPAKGDYARLSGALEGGLTVVSGAELRMNVLAPWPGQPADRHIAQVGTAFRAAFGMPVPIPYVAALILEELATDAAAGSEVTLHDAAARLDSLVAELRYQGEVESNVRASLGLRLRLLLQPGRAERVAGSGPPGWLTARPTLVRLSDLGDEEERAFLAALLVLYISDAARSRGESAAVTHVTVIEEAHRLMPEPRPTGAEDGDAAGVASRLMTQLLAEVRAYGEALVVVDQSPAAVAREVLRNTNLKLAHRIVDTDDQRSLGGALGLSDTETSLLGSLTVGRCLVSSRELVRPQSVQVVAPDLTSRTPEGPPPPTPQPYGARCHRPEDALHHHVSEGAGAEAELAVALWTAAPGGTDIVDLVRRLTTAHPGSRTSCLVGTGIRRHVRTLRRLGQLPGATGREYEAALWQAMIAQAPLPPHPAAEPAARPFQACERCSASCRVRAAVATGALPHLQRARTLAARAGGAKAALDATAKAMEACRAEIALWHPARTATSVGYCLGVHVAAEYGFESALLEYGKT